MYGLEAIAANNGWAISVVGVFHRLHRPCAPLPVHFPGYINSWTSGTTGTISDFSKKTPPDTTEPLHPPFTEREKGSARQFHLLIKTMDDHFSLQRLLHLAEISGLERPHSSLTRLIKTKIIKPDLHGLYLFDNEAFNRFVS